MVLRKKKYNENWVAKEAFVKEKKTKIKDLEAEYSVSKSKVASIEKKVHSFKVIFSLNSEFGNLYKNHFLPLRTKSMTPKWN